MSDPSTPSRPVRWLLTLVAASCLVVGWVGLFVPGLPTTVFWLLAAVCAGKACPAIRRWVYQQGSVGASVQMIVEQRALTAKAKRRATLGMLIGIAGSITLLALLGQANPWLVSILLLAAVIATATIHWGLRTQTNPASAMESEASAT